MESPEKSSLLQPEEPEKPKHKLVRRVAVRPAEKIRPVADTEEVDEVEPMIFELPIPMPQEYEPFDAFQEMSRLSEESRTKTTASPQERRLQLRAKLQQLRETLVRQEMGVGEAVRDLRDAIRSNPDETDLELFARVAALAPKYRFSDIHLYDFWNAIVTYRINHRNVELYRGKFPDDTDLFKECFGRKPKGKVEIEKGPVSLYIHCYDDDDYVRAFNYANTDGDDAKLTEEMRERAMASVGGGLRGVKIEGLADTVAVERSSGIASGHRQFIEDRTAMLAEGDIERLAIDDLAGTVAIMVPDVGVYTLEVGARGDDHRPTRIELYQGEGNSRKLVRAYDRIPNIEDEAIGVLQDDQGITGALMTHEITKDRRAAATITCTYNLVRITNRGHELAGVAYPQHKREVTLDKQQSDVVRTHEEEHLFNRLFEPIAWDVAEREIMARVARTAKTVGEAREMLMKDLSRSARQIMGIDNRARDEMLAYYKDGTTRERIAHRLTQVPVYRYSDSAYYKPKIAELAKIIAGKVEKNMSTMTYIISSSASGSSAEEKMIHAGPLSMSASLVEPFVKKAFGAEYDKEVEHWLDAIGVLETKGYNRDEIVSMLYGERVPDWQAFARRAPEKKKEGA